MVETLPAPMDVRTGREDGVAPPFPPLAEPPTPSPFWAWYGRHSHAAFMRLNRLMVPLLAAGLGPWLSTPASGYMLLLEVTGRRSGATRRIPLSYVVMDGAAWVMAGYGVRTAWYLNVLADPDVVVRLPGRTVRCRAEEILDPAIRARVMPSLTRSAGLPGLLVGCNPWTASDARILGLLDWIPLVRLSPGAGPGAAAEPLAAGPDDPGGKAWVWRQSIALGVTAVAIRQLARFLSRTLRAR